MRVLLGETMKKKKQKNVFAFLGTASGGGAVASAHNVCHGICVGLASLLAMFGIIISDTALMFLQDYNIYFWLMGMFFLLFSIVLLIRKMHVSVRMMIFNAGLLVAANPFSQSLVTTVIGILVSGGIFLVFIKEKTEVIIWKRTR